MSKKMTEQELHNIAMNHVGKVLQDDGYEFLSVNSQLKKDPQFVTLKNKKLNFIVVRSVKYPENPNQYDRKELAKMHRHALKFNACTLYAGVGIANAENYDLPVFQNQDYVLVYKGLQNISK